MPPCNNMNIDHVEPDVQSFVISRYPCQIHVKTLYFYYSNINKSKILGSLFFYNEGRDKGAYP